MSDMGWGIFTLPEDEVTAGVLGGFLDEYRDQRLFMESLTVELKRERRGSNVVDAVAAMANTAGGIVIVGIDEKDPDLESAPGLDESGLTAILEHCRSHITPEIAAEYIPVRLPGSDRIAVVVRVSSDPRWLPVVVGGRVMVRNPGQTVAANHAQVLELVSRRTTYPGSGRSAHSVLSTHAPQGYAPDDSPTRGDLFVRLASAFYTRTPYARPITFGSEVRRGLQDTFKLSSLGLLLPGPPLRGSARPRDFIASSVSDFSSSYCQLAAQWDENEHRGEVRLRAQRSANQVSVAVDVELRLPQPGVTPPAPVVHRSELALAVVCGLETLSRDIVPYLIGAAGGVPVGVDDIVCWVESPRNQDLGISINRDRARRAATGQARSWAGTMRQVEGVADAAEVLRPHWEELYLDLGFDDETEVADHDLREALTAWDSLEVESARANYA
jgi:hypothetical protein